MARKVRVSNERPKLDDNYVERKINKVNISPQRKSNTLLLAIAIVSIIANGVLGYLVFDFHNKSVELESTKKELSTVKNDLSSLRIDWFNVAGYKSMSYVKNKLDFIDDNIVFRIKGFGNYYYSYDCMMDKVNGEYTYWAYNKEAAISEGLRSGGC